MSWMTHVSLKLFLQLQEFQLLLLLLLLFGFVQHGYAVDNEKGIENINTTAATTIIITTTTTQTSGAVSNIGNLNNENVHEIGSLSIITNHITLPTKKPEKREEKNNVNVAVWQYSSNGLYGWLKRYKRPQQQHQHYYREQSRFSNGPPPPSLALRSPSPSPSSLLFPMNFTVSPFQVYHHHHHHLSAAEVTPLTNFDINGSSSTTPKLLSTKNCGGILKSRYGIIQTPSFPHKFITPLECTWIIDANDFLIQPSQNICIVVYLTQLYVLSGLQFTEYMYYSDDYKVPAHRVYTLSEDDVTQVAWMQFNSPYLEIRFQLATLDGTHLRALDRLLDVYGFNITYEVAATVKSYQCNTLQCRFLGHCFAQWDFSSYYCSCFPGFNGIDCGHGPLCNDPYTNICQNGGTCKHIGDAAITCHCPIGFKGTKCEIPDLTEETLGCTVNSSTALYCHQQCKFDHTEDIFSPFKISKIYSRIGKTRYEVTIRLGNDVTTFYRQININNNNIKNNDNDDNDSQTINHQLQLSALLEKHLMRVLRNFNVTKIIDLEVLSNGMNRMDITFHFFGIKTDSQRIQEAVIRMVEKGRIGNITLVSNYYLLNESPPLNLINLEVNHKQPIRENSELILLCTAQGSAHMSFQWYKDGITVNASKATREIWTAVLPSETKDTLTVILGIAKTKSLDEGIYTCKVTDWDVEQCRSIYVHIKSPPRLRVDPASVTLHRGDSLRVRCLSPGNDDIKRYAQLGYSWTRNGLLFQSDPKTAMWEDLYPDGSILKINNIQKSAEYSCIVSNSVQPVMKSAYITVVDMKAVHVCHAHILYGIHWPTSAPGGIPIKTQCPRGYEGYTRRICEKRDSGNSTWLIPDFSSCIRDQLLIIYNKFRSLTFGFQETDTSELLLSCWHYTIKWYKKFLPGEGSFLINMLYEINNYLQLKGTQLEREMAAEIILHILDKIMQNAHSLNNQQQIKKLQLLTQSAVLNRETIAASQLATSTINKGVGGITIVQKPSLSSSTSSLSSLSVSSLTTISTATVTATSSSLSPSLNFGIVDSYTFNEFSTVVGQSKSHSIITTPNGNKQQAITIKGKLKQQQQRQQATDSMKTDSISQQGDSSYIQGNTIIAASSNIAGHNSILMVDEDSLSLERLNSLRIFMTSVKTLPFNLRIYGDDLFSDQVYMDIGYSERLLHIMANNTIFATVISYKNLNNFLPKTYYSKGSDSKDSDYMLASRVIQTWLFQANRSNDNLRVPLDLPFDSGHVEIIFQHEYTAKDGAWMAVCGHDYRVTFEFTWRSDLCITKSLMENVTRCICPVSGTYVILLTKRNNNLQHTVQTSPRPLFVIISCVCCLLQSCSAFIMLLAIWYNRHCAITFLKMQFCFSTSSIMIIFLLGFLKMLPLHWQPVISSSLASLLLLGISTLIAITLVLHTELVTKKLLPRNDMTAATTTTTPTASLHNAFTAKNTNNFLDITAAVNAKKESSNGPECELDKCTNKVTSQTPLTRKGAEVISKMPTIITSNVITAPQTMISTNIIGKNMSEGNLIQISTSNRNDMSKTNTQFKEIHSRNSQEQQLKQLKVHHYYQRQQHHHHIQQHQLGSNQQAIPSITSYSVQAGVKGAITISWLLPLLYGVAAPLICTINGKWPQNWWLEIMAYTNHQKGFSDIVKELPHETFFTRNLHKPFQVSSNKLSLSQPISTPITYYRSLLNNGDDTWEYNNNTSTSNNNIGQTTNNIPNYNSYITPSTSTTTMSLSTATTVTSAWHMRTSSITSSILNNHHKDNISYNYNEIDESEQQYMSLNFIIFICVDILILILFCGLFSLLLNKLLHLSRKVKLHCCVTSNSNSRDNSPRKPPPYHLDTFKENTQQSIGLLYRVFGLLLAKLLVDILFVVYSNSVKDSWWGYPFGFACILLGFAIVLCFILKPECEMSSSHLTSTSHSNKQLPTFSTHDMLKSNINSSKTTNLDNNSYHGGSINTPLNFYGNYEKEKDSESGAPLLLSLTSMQNLPTSKAQGMNLEVNSSYQLSGFTMLSSTVAPASVPMLPSSPTLPPSTRPPSSPSSSSTTLHGVTDQLPVNQCHHLKKSKPIVVVTSSSLATTSGNNSYNVIHDDASNMLTPVACTNLPSSLVVGNTLTYYDAYTNLNKPCQLTSFNACPAITEINGPSPEFVTLENFDMLQRVNTDVYSTNNDICTMTATTTPSSHNMPSYSHNIQQQPHGEEWYQSLPTVNLVQQSTQISNPTVMSSINGLTRDLPIHVITTIKGSVPSIAATSSATTQTTKIQKHVTIMEPTTHTFDPLLPTMVAVTGAHISMQQHAHQQQQQQQKKQQHLQQYNPKHTPAITITNASLDDETSTHIELKDLHLEQSQSTQQHRKVEINESDTVMLDRITHDLNYLLNCSTINHTESPEEEH